MAKSRTRVTETRQYCKCMDCGTRRMVQTREWDRAARPRCYACGGVLVQLESAQTKSRQVSDTMRDAARYRKELTKEKQEGEGLNA